MADDLRRSGLSAMMAFLACVGLAELRVRQAVNSIVRQLHPRGAANTNDVATDAHVCY